MTRKINRVVKLIKRKTKRIVKKLQFADKHYVKMISFSLLSVMIPMSILPALALEADDNFESKIALSKDSAVVQHNTTKPEIILGESQAEAEIRQRKEAEAKTAIKHKTITQIVNKQFYNDPSDLQAVYQSAASRYGVDWQILKAIHYVETGCSGSTHKKNPSGASGPMQFMPSTWRVYGIDGNGDGIKDIYNVEDAIYAAANYLQASGGSTNKYQKALWAYNPSSRYYVKVMEVAKNLGL